MKSGLGKCHGKAIVSEDGRTLEMPMNKLEECEKSRPRPKKIYKSKNRILVKWNSAKIQNLNFYLGEFELTQKLFAENSRKFLDGPIRFILNKTDKWILFLFYTFLNFVKWTKIQEN